MKPQIPVSSQIFILLLLVLVSSYFAQILASIGITAIAGSDVATADLNQPKYMYIIVFCTQLAMFLLGVLAFLKIIGKTFKQEFDWTKFNSKNLLKVLGVFILAFVVVEPLSRANLWLMDQYPTSMFYEMAIEQKEKYAVWFNVEKPELFPFALIIYGLVPAIVEELLFRGLLLKKLWLVSNKMHFGVIVSSLIFAAIHVQPWNLLPMIFMGLVLGYIYVYTKDIRYNILAHFLFNALNLVVAFYFPEWI
ncbi:CPBP family intramembrane metalloprotease [Paracrocinitomix mangrovi]|uniref:CPBP family intramembrane glutamic endopeptidase n=1 Tax=Paracrocinitomix mangrovi TaxID=2862509 RepID=UPI001C8D3F32|nr:CPBP family intramembrane glutamic endopeptidase [Paracrocinitomix mangrovi]UKN00686.1 CPBP family intramembrane metalloprotease [Paracrocinitomix mangrovi]